MSLDRARPGAGRVPVLIAAMLLAGLSLVLSRADTASAAEYGEGACVTELFTDETIPDCTAVESPWVARSGIVVESVGWAIYCSDDRPYNWNYFMNDPQDPYSAFYSYTTGGAEVPAQAGTTFDEENSWGGPDSPGKADWYSTIWFSGSFKYEVGCSSQTSLSGASSSSEASAAASSGRGRETAATSIADRKLVRHRRLRPHRRIVHRHRCPGGRKLLGALHGVGYFTEKAPEPRLHTERTRVNKRGIKVVVKTKDTPRGKVVLQTQIQCERGRAG